MVFAQQPEDYGHTMFLVKKSANVPAPTLCQANAGWLYTITGSTLRVVSLSDPLTPVVSGTLDGLGTVSDFFVVGQRAYLACGASGLSVIDLTDRAHPALAGTLVLPTAATAVAQYGTLIAVGGGSAFSLVDTADPLAMSIVGQTTTIAASDLAIAGRYALVTGTAGIATIDLADVTAPQQVALFRDDLGNWSEQGQYPQFSTIVVDGGRAAVLSEQWGIYSDGYSSYLTTFGYVVTLNAENPATLANMAGQRLDATALQLRDDCVMVTSGSLLQAYDAETMEFRGSIGNASLAGAATWPDGRYVYAGLGSGLGIYDVTYPETVLPFATWGAGMSHAGGSARFDLAKAYTSNGSLVTMDYRLYDSTDPLLPDLRLSASLAGGTAYVTPSVEISDIEGDYVLLRCSSGGPSGVMVYNMGMDPVDGAALPYLNAFAKLSGTIAWVMTEDGTLVSVDCSDLDHLQTKATITVPGGELKIEGEYAWLRRLYPNQLTLLNLHDAAAPQICGSVSLPGSPNATLFRDGWAYVCCTGAGLRVLNVSNLSAPAITGSVPTALVGSWIMASGDIAVIATGTGFQVLSLADPALPQILSPVVGVSGLMGAPVLRDHRLYVGHDYGMNVYDLTDPANPLLLGCASRVGGVVYEGSNWIIAPGGAYPLDAGEPVAVGPSGPPRAAATSLSVAPNPFNPVTTVRFAITGTHNVDIGIHDVRGARVRDLVTGRWADGRHEVKWDGRDNSGRTLGSGSYFARLSLDGGATAQTARVTLLK